MKQSNRNFGTTIDHMPMSKWAILQNWYTTSTNHQPTIIHHSYLHQEQGRNLTFMLSTNKEYMQCHHFNTNNLKPVNINLSN